MTEMVAAAEVRIGGRALDPTLAERLVEVRVDDNLMLPDSFLLRVADPGLEHVDSSPFEIGAEIEIKLAAADATSTTRVLTGQITAVEPEFGRDGAVLAARGYDHSHQLNRTKVTATYQNMTFGDIAGKIARKAGLKRGTIDSAGGVHEFVQQNSETYWEFLWRLAERIDFEVLVVDKTLHFRKAGGSNGGPLGLRWGETLESFRPRVTGVQQVDEVVVRGWDPKTKRAIEATARSAKVDSQIGTGRGKVASSLGGGTITVGDRAVASRDEAEALAKSVLARLANAYVEAEGTAAGDPRLRAGTKVRIDGVGSRFGGTYTLSSTSHVYRSGRGYRTHFAIAGRAPRNLVDLMTPAAARRWGGALVIGIVTQNQDPDGLGRVRVKYPSLGEDTEGWWARITAPAAGKDRGLLMMPVVGEEVLVGFEHGDPRKPYVLGSLWNAKEKPGNLVQPDGSFVLASDKQLVVSAKEPISIKGDKDLTIEAGGKAGQKAAGDFSIDGQKVTVKGQTSVVVEAGTDLTIKASSLKIQASGVVQISGAQIMLG